MSSVAKVFKAARLEKQLTQAQLAEKAGIYVNTYALIERGVQEPTFATVKKIAKALGLNLADL